MADVRSLLQKERDSRRLHHPHLSYTKSGVLTCSVCHLHIQSEALWDGHLKSANHRKNAQKATDEDVGLSRGTKRKIDDDVPDAAGRRVASGEGRKKTKSVQFVEGAETVAVQERDEGVLEGFVAAQEAEKTVQEPAGLPDRSEEETPREPTSLVVDEDEWAAFEREVVPLAQPDAVADYSNAIISAAPMTAAEVAAQSEMERRSRRDTEAEDEVEDEQRRMQDEFEVMEEMEERVKRLKEQREALRQGLRPRDQVLGAAAGPPVSSLQEEDQDKVTGEKEQTADGSQGKDAQEDGDGDDDDDDDADDADTDDWFS